MEGLGSPFLFIRIHLVFLKNQIIASEGVVMKIITLENKSFPLEIDENDIEIIVAEEVHRHIYGKYPTYYQLFGHPNWKSYHEQR
tara:strand:- start:74 stop:328 length:255 start_codon:yes stop_codon:yes gene_type:complete